MSQSVKLSRLQEAVLRLVVSRADTGLRVYPGDPRIKTLLALQSRGLVEGKEGDAGCAISTKVGISWVRDNMPITPQRT